jgi:hypothetical protein
MGTLLGLCNWAHEVCFTVVSRSVCEPEHRGKGQPVVTFDAGIPIGREGKKIRPRPGFGIPVGLNCKTFIYQGNNFACFTS